MNLIVKSAASLLVMATVMSCGERAEQSSSNPLLESWDTPFGIAPFERIKADHYEEAFEVAFAKQSAAVERIVSDTTEVSFSSVIAALDHSMCGVLDLKDLFEMSEAAISDDDWVRVGERVKPLISQSRDSILMNEALFEKINTLYKRRESLGLSAVEMHLLERTYNNFVRGGALLSAEDKRRMSEINSRIAALSSRFSSNLMAENNKRYLNLGTKDLKGLYNDTKLLAKEEAIRRGLDNRWVITLNPSSMIPFLMQSENRALREKIYKAYLQRGANGDEHDNQDIVREVSALRQERAKMLGYKNHADYVISQQMAGSVEAAYNLLDKVWSPALEAAKKERDELQELLTKDNDIATLEPWDWWFYSEKLRKERFNVTSETLSSYFSIGGVRTGIFTLANRLYGITFRPVNVPQYDSSCNAYEVLDRNGVHVGVLYLDLYARPSKGQGAWCGNLREQWTDGGDRITPVVAVVCNFAPPVQDQPSLLTMEQVETLFHEFGHALHFLMQDVEYRQLSAAAVEGDFVEFPSQVMENWAFEPEMLSMYALHYRTARPMPENMVESISKMSKFNKGYETLAYTAAALLDLDLQTTESFEEFNIKDFEFDALRKRRGMIREIEPRYHLTNFSHLFTYDYSAGYYFYLWSEVLDQDCFEMFKRSGDIFSRELADRLQREVLRRGSEASGAELYRNFKGGEPSEIPMLKSKGLYVESPVTDSLSTKK